jgi:Resolvase, N terminal domain
MKDVEYLALLGPVGVPSPRCSITGGRIVRLDNVRPAHWRHLRPIEALKLERSLQSRCLEVSIMFISGRLDVLHQIKSLRPASNGVRTIIVETANRFSRDLIVQETGHRMLKAQGIEIIAADSPGAFVEDTPTATLVRQVLGAVAHFDKAMTVAKLRLARDRIRKQDGKCEGRKSHAEERPEVVDLVKRLQKQGMSYRAISSELAKARPRQ